MGRAVAVCPRPDHALHLVLQAGGRAWVRAGWFRRAGGFGGFGGLGGFGGVASQGI